MGEFNRIYFFHLNHKKKKTFPIISAEEFAGEKLKIETEKWKRRV